MASWSGRPGKISILFTGLGAFDINKSSMLFIRVGFEFDWCRPKSSRIVKSLLASRVFGAPGKTSCVLQRGWNHPLVLYAR